MEYKFRGKNNSKWLYGSLLQRLSGNCYMVFEYGGVQRELQVDPETVGMFTTRTDKNGKEIFAGDKDDEYGVVVFDDEYLGFFCRPNYPNRDDEKPLYDCPLFEIISTIHGKETL